MKKYATGLIAVVLAIAMSAFTRQMEKKASSLNEENKDLTYWWYRVGPFGEMTASSLAFMSKQTITYAENNDGCFGFSVDCLRGFRDPITYFPSYQTSQIRTLKPPPQ